MKNLFKVTLIAIMISATPVFVSLSFSQPTQEYFVDSLEILANEALEGYNLEDYIKFYQYFSKDMSGLTSKEYFKAVFLDSYKKDLGDIIAKKLLAEKSFLDSNYPILVYNGTFEKANNVLVTINFEKEYDSYRISMIRFDRLYGSVGFSK